MTFAVTVPITGEALPVVPALAVQWSRAGAFVWRVAGPKAEKVPVVIRKRDGDAVFVEAALKPEDTVAVEGAQKLNETSEVAVAEPGGPPADAAPAPPRPASPGPGAAAAATAR